VIMMSFSLSQTVSNSLRPSLRLGVCLGLFLTLFYPIQADSQGAGFTGAFWKKRPSPLVNGSFTIVQGSLTNSTTVTLNIGCATGGRGTIEVAYGGATGPTNWSTCASTKSHTLTTGDGTKIVYLWFRDQAGSTTSELTRSIVLDQTAPSGGAFSIAQGTLTNSTSISLSITCPTDANGPVQVAFGNATSPTNWTACTSSIAHTLTAGDGSKTVYLRFRDAATNTTTNLTRTITVDTVAPSGGSFTIAQGSTTSTQAVSLNVVCPTDANGPIQVAYGNTSAPSNWTTCATPISHTLTSGDGTKTVYMRFRDGALNMTTVISQSITYNSCVLGSSQSFTSSGEVSFIVPSCASSITIKVWGGGGGGNNPGVVGSGGGGGYARATFTVTPGETLTVGVASGGARGGGGGGMSYVRRASTYLIIAAGGGGAGTDGNSGNSGVNANANGGPGGGASGTKGVDGVSSSSGAWGTGTGGGGGSSSAGGAGGTVTAQGNTSTSSQVTPGLDGSVNNGGRGGGGSGGFNVTTCSCGAYGGSTWQGGTGGQNGVGGGGGAGYYGGGGGVGRYTYFGAGGGGGSSFVNGGTSAVLTSGSGTAPGGSGDANYTTGRGVGGAPAGAGGAGAAWISW
jgi:hypothetical protein